MSSSTTACLTSIPWSDAIKRISGFCRTSVVIRSIAAILASEVIILVFSGAFDGYFAVEIWDHNGRDTLLLERHVNSWMNLCNWPTNWTRQISTRGEMKERSDVHIVTTHLSRPCSHHTIPSIHFSPTPKGPIRKEKKEQKSQVKLSLVYCSKKKIPPKVGYHAKNQKQMPATTTPLNPSFSFPNSTSSSSCKQ